MFLETILGQPCSAAWTVKLQNQATHALRPCYNELAATLPAQSQLGIDETPNKEGPRKTWLWAFVAKRFTVFALRLTRAATVLDELLSDRFDGVVMCDRAKMYWSLGCLQWCWAHLKRDFQALIDSDDRQVKRLGQDLMRPTRKMFAGWKRYRDGTLTRGALKQLMMPIRAEIEGLLLRGVFSGNQRLQGMCNELYDHRQWLWNFIEQEDVEPTNNGSERALRHAVIWRKLSFGTQSASGNRFVETMLTVIETCRQQGRNTFAFVADAVQLHFAGDAAPKLLAGA
jgi:transposase